MPHPTGRFVTVTPDPEGILTPVARTLPASADRLTTRQFLDLLGLDTLATTPAASGILVWHGSDADRATLYEPAYPGLPTLLTGHRVPPRIAGPVALTGSDGRHAVGLTGRQLDLIHRAFIGWLDDYPTPAETTWERTVTGWLRDAVDVG